MKRTITDFMKTTFWSGLCGLILFSNIAHTQQSDVTPELANPVTWADGGNSGGVLQADRRAWLAARRTKMAMANPDQTNVTIEKLDEIPARREKELPREVLNSYLLQIKSEIE